MPCMNLISAAVCCTRDRSDAWAAPITRVACPGAPGCTITGVESVLVVRQPAAPAARSTMGIREEIAVPRMEEVRTSQSIHGNTALQGWSVYLCDEPPQAGGRGGG